MSYSGDAVPISGTITVTGTMPVTPVNRWAAFTDDEMLEIQSCMGYAEQNHPAKVNEDWERIMGETNAELQRRGV